MFRPEGSIDFFARNEYKRRERERTKEHETDSPRSRLHCSVLRHNAKPMSFIPFYPFPSLSLENEEEEKRV